jgi:hypothetical protein
MNALLNGGDTVVFSFMDSSSIVTLLWKNVTTWTVHVTDVSGVSSVCEIPNSLLETWFDTRFKDNKTFLWNR